MKTYFAFIAGICIFACVTACSSVQTIPVSTLQNKNVEVYFTNRPNQPFSEVSYLEVSGSVFHSQKALLNKMQQKAQEQKADALVDVRFYYIPWAFSSLPAVSAIAVRCGEKQASK